MEPPTTDLPKEYEPASFEARWYQFWLDHDLFRAGQRPEARPFTIVIPPPNITGKLHFGHALNNTLQDILVRRRRMQGFDALWLPGTDHAGIATQMVVERALRERGISRHDLGREKFLEEVWRWKEKHGGEILATLRKLGASCDFSRTRFTLDEGLSRAVREVFVSLYEDGLIYRTEDLITGVRRAGPRSRTSRSRSRRGPAAISGRSPIRSRTGARGSWSRPRVPRRCSATPRSPSIRRTSATATSSAGRSSCPSWGAGSPSSATPSWSIRRSGRAWSRSRRGTISTTSRRGSGTISR
jgi:hypothetical protein